MMYRDLKLTENEINKIKENLLMDKEQIINAFNEIREITFYPTEYKTQSKTITNTIIKFIESIIFNEDINICYIGTKFPDYIEKKPFKIYTDFKHIKIVFLYKKYLLHLDMLVKKHYRMNTCSVYLHFGKFNENGIYKIIYINKINPLFYEEDIYVKKYSMRNIIKIFDLFPEFDKTITKINKNYKILEYILSKKIGVKVNVRNK